MVEALLRRGLCILFHSARAEREPYPIHLYLARVGARLRRARSQTNTKCVNDLATCRRVANERSYTGATQSRPYPYFFSFAQNLAKRSKPFAIVSSDVA